ncbi:hypothetical protein E3N88_10001 [Mikania micrantha]|uniref:Uncharacterized protein n=1 Tax=Mikania micrantha TaxID=192012 RepID=A0A5N6P9F9_9ASTR|nr:hypothetical protein E3N88_10001 [Mikania micrantha]
MEEDVVIKLVVEEARLEEEEDVEEVLDIEAMTRVNQNAMNVVNMVTSDMNALRERKVGIQSTAASVAVRGVMFGSRHPYI